MDVFHPEESEQRLLDFVERLKHCVTAGQQVMWIDGDWCPRSVITAALAAGIEVVKATNRGLAARDIVVAHVSLTEVESFSRVVAPLAICKDVRAVIFCAPDFAEIAQSKGFTFSPLDLDQYDVK